MIVEFFLDYEMVISGNDIPAQSYLDPIWRTVIDGE
jgi:hypothetical protein